MSRLYLWFNPCAFLAHFLHTGLRAQSAPGFPCALFKEEGQRILHNSGENGYENARVCPLTTATP